MVEFSQEIFDAICEHIADGKSLRSICLKDGMPSKTSVMRWLMENEALRDQYTRARELQADVLADETLDIADDATNDWMESRSDAGSVGYRLNGEHIQRSKLRIDQRKWMAGKLRPKVYGDRVAIGGAADMDPIKTEEVGGSSKLEAFLNAVAGRADSGATE